MTPEEVVGLVGKPDKVSEWATGKKWIPFSFSTDNNRIKWVYNGAGYIHFSRHEYTDKVRVIEIVLDPDIK